MFFCLSGGPGETMTVAVTARTAGKVMLNVVADRLITTLNQDVQPGLNQIRVPVGRDWALRLAAVHKNSNKERARPLITFMSHSKSLK